MRIENNELWKYAVISTFQKTKHILNAKAMLVVCKHMLYANDTWKPREPLW